ncbi:MAG: TldD/PmbA family protein [Deltaproteobacteria bacterium]|nr:TldD/PmbA family protein [Deltaproteobacteria bacterium]
MLEKFDLKKILSATLHRGGEFADIYCEETEGIQLIAEERKLEKINPSIDCGIGIRLLWEGKTSYGFTNELSEKSLLELAETVSQAASAKKFDQTISLHSINPPFHFTIEKATEKSPLEKKRDWMREAEEAAWGFDSRIHQVKVLYADIRKRVEIANSLGELTRDDRTYTLFYVQAIAGQNGQIQTGYHPVGGLIGLELFDQHPPVSVARRACEQAIRMLAARKAPGGQMPVVISSEAGGTMIHEAVGHGLEADLASEGLSVYHKKIGERIGGEKISVVDDATLPTRRGSFVFDDEGVPAERTLLVDHGILKNYMYDRKMAMKDGARPTGNGRRESYRFRPICRMTNTMILPGTDDPDSILRSTERGLFVKKMGGGQVNTVNGDFIFEINEGCLIEKGQIGDPVRGAVLTGNGPHVLKIIDKVGSDLGFGIGTCGKDNQGVPVGDAQPTIRIPELVVGGQLES